MNVAVDTSGQRQQTRCIDLPRRPLNAVGNAHDAAFANADIGAEFVAGGRNRAASDSEVKLFHVNFLPLGSTKLGPERPAPNLTILSDLYPRATSFATA